MLILWKDSLKSRTEINYLFLQLAEFLIRRIPERIQQIWLKHHFHRFDISNCYRMLPEIIKVI